MLLALLSGLIVRFLLGSPGANAPGGLPAADPKLDELKALPVGIVVSHTPNPVCAQRGGRSGSHYTWQFKTTVRAKHGSLRILEFGVFAWQGGRWVFSNYTGRLFGPKEFAEWYSCPDALVLAEAEYSDPSNWAGADTLRRGKARWYFIGVTEGGERVKGEALVEQEPIVR